MTKRASRQSALPPIRSVVSMEMAARPFPRGRARISRAPEGVDAGQQQPLPRPHAALDDAPVPRAGSPQEPDQSRAVSAPRRAPSARRALTRSRPAGRLAPAPPHIRRQRGTNNAENPGDPPDLVHA